MEPVIGSLQPYEWSSEQSVAYEAAVEAINGVVGAYSSLLAQHEELPAESRNEAAVRAYRDGQGRAQRAREALDAADAAAVAAVRREYSQRLHVLNQRLRETRENPS